MSDNIQTNNAGQTLPCVWHQIEKIRYLIEVHFSNTSAQNVEDRLKRVILHDLAQCGWRGLNCYMKEPCVFVTWH